MHPEFWHQRWANNQIGFHESVVNPMLLKHFFRLNLAKGSRIFLPLCGKTLDIAWLLAQGYQVVGAELSKVAIDQLFWELEVKPEIGNEGKLEHYRAHNLDILVGDIFDVAQLLLGKVDAVYDRAALVALPADMRRRYTKHLIDLTNAAPQLLVSFEYDQDLMNGPPFSVTKDEVTMSYGAHYQLALLEQVYEKLKDEVDAMEAAWLLNR